MCAVLVKKKSGVGGIFGVTIIIILLIFLNHKFPKLRIEKSGVKPSETGKGK
jgi:hypothetical protein